MIWKMFYIVWILSQINGLKADERCLDREKNQPTTCEMKTKVVIYCNTTDDLSKLNFDCENLVPNGTKLERLILIFRNDMKAIKNELNLKSAFYNYKSLVLIQMNDIDLDVDLFAQLPASKTVSLSIMDSQLKLIKNGMPINDDASQCSPEMFSNTKSIFGRFKSIQFSNTVPFNGTKLCPFMFKDAILKMLTISGYESVDKLTFFDSNDQDLNFKVDTIEFSEINRLKLERNFLRTIFTSATFITIVNSQLVSIDSNAFEDMRRLRGFYIYEMEFAQFYATFLQNISFPRR